MENKDEMFLGLRQGKHQAWIALYPEMLKSPDLAYVIKTMVRTLERAKEDALPTKRVATIIVEWADEPNASGSEATAPNA